MEENVKGLIEYTAPELAGGKREKPRKNQKFIQSAAKFGPKKEQRFSASSLPINCLFRHNADHPHCPLSAYSENISKVEYKIKQVP
jgi:hypothetical protein